MKFNLKNIAIIIVLNILLCVFVSVKIINSDSLYSSPLVYTDNSLDLHLFLDNNTSFSKSKCITHPNFYTPEEIIDIFQFKDYKPCKPTGDDKISYNEGVFDIKCSKKKKPKYAVDSKKFETYGGSMKYSPKWFTSFPSISDKQFLFIRCSASSQYAFVFNHFKQSAADAAKKIQKKLGNNKVQMSVLLLVLDSISKYSFERNLPLTTNFLKSLKTNKKFDKYFWVYQFNKSAVPQAATRPNMAQILYGKSWEEISKNFGTNTKLLELRKKLYLKYQKNAIWSHFSSLGYVTMFSHASVNDYISSFTGRYIKADHVFTNFWKYLWGVTGLHPYQNGQKCLGNRNFHDFLFDYTYQFFKNYPNNNKFAYVHSDAAHENTGNIKTIDEDLLRFLKKYLKLTKTRKEDLAIFLMSDHGNKKLKGSSQWDKRTFFEFHTPFTYLIATRNVIKSFKINENLKHNENQLVSRFDINLSLKHLAYFPYNQLPKDWYQQAKSYYTYNNIVSLFEEKINNNRTCSDIGVKKESCLCSWYEPVEINENENIIKKQMIILLSLYLNNPEEQNKKCSVLNKIENVKVSDFILVRNLERLVKVYKLEITTKNNSEIIVDFNFCLKSDLGRQEESFELNGKPFSYPNLNDGTYFLQLNQVHLPEKCINDFCVC